MRMECVLNALSDSISMTSESVQKFLMNVESMILLMKNVMNAILAIRSLIIHASNQMKTLLINIVRNGRIMFALNAPKDLFWTLIISVNLWIPFVKLTTEIMDSVLAAILDLLSFEAVAKFQKQLKLILIVKSLKEKNA